MTFVALLTKELRLHLRRERAIWVIIAYLAVMGLLGWISVNGASNNPGNYGPMGLSVLGLGLYLILSLLQLFLILFTVPAFTATAVNSEKERQTFDLLLCSRLSSFSLISGKLLAGLANALLLVAASIPLFSMVFFFGGIAPAQVFAALAVYAVTVLLTGSLGLFCSTIFSRPAVSTSITYIVCLVWITFPLIATYIISSTGVGRWFQVYPNHMRLIYLWNPVAALNSTFPVNATSEYFYYGGYYNGFYSVPLLGSLAGPSTPLIVYGVRIAPWIVYSGISLLLSALLVLASTLLIKPHSFQRLWRAHRKVKAGPVVPEGGAE